MHAYTLSSFLIFLLENVQHCFHLHTVWNYELQNIFSSALSHNSYYIISRGENKNSIILFIRCKFLFIFSKFLFNFLLFCCVLSVYRSLQCTNCVHALYYVMFHIQSFYVFEFECFSLFMDAKDKKKSTYLNSKKPAK